MVIHRTIIGDNDGINHSHEIFAGGYITNPNLAGPKPQPPNTFAGSKTSLRIKAQAMKRLLTINKLLLSINYYELLNYDLPISQPLLAQSHKGCYSANQSFPLNQRPGHDHMAAGQASFLGHAPPVRLAQTIFSFHARPLVAPPEPGMLLSKLRPFRAKNYE